MNPFVAIVKLTYHDLFYIAEYCLFSCSREDKSFSPYFFDIYFPISFKGKH